MKMPAALKRHLQVVMTPSLYSRVTTMLLPRTTAKSTKMCRRLLVDKSGFEVGGPSCIFSADGLMPLYPVVANVDNCNFSHATTWEGELCEGLNYHFSPRRPPGFQYIREAADLAGIPSQRYDFLLSSHNIEHLANPLKALYEWRRVIVSDGILVLVVPHREGTFDWRRPVTPLAHILDDYEQGRDESDLTHLGEVLELHDLEQDAGSSGIDSFKERSLRNVENRCIHHHVFDTEAVVELMHYAGFELLAIEALPPNNIIAIGRKAPEGKSFDNSRFRGATAAFHRTSPFVGDRYQPCGAE